VVGGNVVTASCDGKARLISLEDGKETASAPLDDPVASTPAKVGDRLYLGTMGDAVVCLDARTLQPIWRQKLPDAGKFFASPAVGDEVAVFGSRQRRVVAVSRADGAVKWTFKPKGNVDSSPAIVGDRVFFGSEDGRIYGVNLATGDKVWEHVCGERVSASPAVASGKLVVADGEGNAYCFGAK
jgi:glucose dehydrogenase